MSLVPEEFFFIRDTLAQVTPIVHAHYPGADIESDCFDAYVTVMHGPGEEIDTKAAFGIARELRGGHDVNRQAPTDWHVRSIGPHLILSDQGNHPRERERIGTSIWFSRTFTLPEGYDETIDTTEIRAPQVAPMRPE